MLGFGDVFVAVVVVARGSSGVKRSLGVARRVLWRRERVSLVVRLRAS
jgi:hypothetical protein